MATTKIKAIKQTVYKAISYITNPLKTDGQLLVSSYNCNSETAAIEFKITQSAAESLKGNYKKTGGANNQAYHLMQSFSPKDNITPEQATEIGKKLADEFSGGKYEYVIATHINKGHIHNHIIINATSFYDYKKLQTQPYKTAAKLRAISDRLCSENNLSVVADKQKLSYSYKEWQERKKNTSWKSEIRKKLNFVLECTTSIEDFKNQAEQLGVIVETDTANGEILKHTKYKLENQERWTRGNKLSDTDIYTLEGIKNRLDSNKQSQDYIKDAIKNNIKKVTSFKELEEKLKSEFGISFSKQRNGNTIIAIDDTNSTKVKDIALGYEYTPEAIAIAISKQSFDFEDIDKKTIFEEYEKTIKTKAEDNYTKIRLNPNNIEKVVDGKMNNELYSGLLIKVPNDKDNGTVFIDCMHVNFDQRTGEYDIFIGDKFDYYFTKSELNPDISEGDQLSNFNIKGEELIRSMEIENGVEPAKVQLLGAEIKTMSEKGVSISLPGIDNLFISNEYVTYDKIKGICTVDLYENWNYSCKQQAGEDSERKTLKGNEILNLISSSKIGKMPIYKRISYAERKIAAASTKELAQGLLLMRQNNVVQPELLNSSIDKLINEVKELQAQNSIIEKENATFKMAASYLVSLNKYQELYNKYQEKPLLYKNKFYAANEFDLKTYEHALAELLKMNVNTDVDPKKVYELIKKKTDTIKSNFDIISKKNKEIKKYREAQQAVINVTQRQKNKPSHRDER